MAALKLAPIPDRTPVKLAVHLPPELHRALGDYAAIYTTVYGREESVADLIPAILSSFLESDRAFQAARRELLGGGSG